MTWSTHTSITGKQIPKGWNTATMETGLKKIYDANNSFVFLLFPFWGGCHLVSIIPRHHLFRLMLVTWKIFPKVNFFLKIFLEKYIWSDNVRLPCWRGQHQQHLILWSPTAGAYCKVTMPKNLMSWRDYYTRSFGLPMGALKLHPEINGQWNLNQI